MWEAEGRPSSFLAETGEITFEVTPRSGDCSEFVRNQLGLDSCSESGIPSLGIPPLNAATARVTYRFNGQPVAVREGGSLTFVYGDHLGSTNLTTNLTGTRVSELRYYPFGETRYSNGTTSTSKRFTSQEEQIDIGLYDYGARFYDPALGRFVSADSVVPQPGAPQSINRYSYVRNSPLTRIDPSGHVDLGCKDGDNACWTNQWVWNNRWYQQQRLLASLPQWDDPGNRISPDMRYSAAQAYLHLLADPLYFANLYL
jgi:RHS repeat-associated protein